MKLFTPLLVLSAFALYGCFPVAAQTKLESGQAVYSSGVKEGVQELNADAYKNIGRACVKNYAYLISVGDASIEAAKANGNITNVSKIEREKSGFGFVLFFLPFIYGESCTVVYGS